MATVVLRRLTLRTLLDTAIAAVVLETLNTVGTLHFFSPEKNF